MRHRDEVKAEMLDVTQHSFDHDMPQWGVFKGAEVHEQGQRQSRLLGPDVKPLVYPKSRPDFDLPLRR